MPIRNLKQEIAFPECGQIRKGYPKQKIKKNGYEVETVGKDLGARFRVVFYDGTDNQLSRERFLQGHQGHITVLENGDIIVDPAELAVLFPLADPSACWDAWYEAYTAGRLVARADGERFIRLIENGRVVVSNGEPYTPFVPGQVVGTYRNKKGEVQEIKSKATGRLRVVLPELLRMATMTVHTTSIYDVARITQQLGALQFIARMLPNHTGVAGIPLSLTRRMTEVTWSQPDGSARRVKTALLTIEADPEWVARMFARMASLALPTGELQAALLPAGDQVELEIDERDLPQAEAQIEEAGFDEDEFTEAEYSVSEPPEEPPLDIAEPALAPAGRTTGAKKAGAKSAPLPEPAAAQPSRPYPAETVRQALLDAVVRYDTQTYEIRNGESDPDKLRGIVAANLEMCFAGDKSAGDKRHTLLAFVFGEPSVKKLSHHQLIALKRWLAATSDSGGEWRPNPMSATEAQALVSAALVAEGQLALFGEEATE